MTREEAISWLVSLTEHEGEDIPIYDTDVEALNMAIKALEQESTTKNDLGVDAISREQALRELKESAEHHANDSREEALLRRDRDIIRALPSVAPQESILDKIRAEIESINLLAEYTRGDIKRMALNVIDKYKTESEG